MTARPFGPLTDDHWCVQPGDGPNKTCPACNQRFRPGEITTIVSVGPGDDQDARQRARDGRAYNAVAVVAHWSCVTGSDDPRGDYESYAAEEKETAA